MCLESCLVLVCVCENEEERWINYVEKCEKYNAMTEELQTCDPAIFTDGVLDNLMRMGIMDWTGENVRMNQSTQAIRLATALAS